MAGSNQCIPFQEDADRVTGQCVEEVKGKRFVSTVENLLSGPGMPATAQVGASDPVDGGNFMVAHCPAGARALGVSTWDEVSGGKIGIISEGIVPVTAGANLAAGQTVAVGAEGKAVAAAAEGTAATLEFGAGNAIIKLTQVAPGASKTKIVLAIAGANTPLTVTVAGEVTTVHVGTNALSEAVSTAAEVINAINSTAASSAVLQAANGGASNGTGVVAAKAETALAGGTSPTADVGLCLTGVASGEDAMIKLHC
jgi:hypothetical protein